MTNTIEYFSLLLFQATNACDPNPCRNGGRCTDVKGQATCSCQPRFEGEKCESKWSSNGHYLFVSIFELENMYIYAVSCCINTQQKKHDNLEFYWSLGEVSISRKNNILGHVFQCSFIIYSPFSSQQMWQMPSECRLCREWSLCLSSRLRWWRCHLLWERRYQWVFYFIRSLLSWKAFS